MMEKIGIKVAALAALALTAGVLLGSNVETVQADAQADIVAEGKKIALDRKKGNCLSCHFMDNGPMPGTHGPPLILMERRFPDKSKLRARIYDATAADPNTMMPPFGRHGILTDDDIDKITEYIYTL